MNSWNEIVTGNSLIYPHALESPFPHSMVLPAGPSLQGSAAARNTRPARLRAAPAVKAAARFLGLSPSLVYAYVERKQIPHYRMMGRSIRFRLSELAEWPQQFHVNGGIDEQQDR